MSTHKYGPPLSANQIEFVAQSFQAGRPAHEIAPLVPCSKATVWKYYQRIKRGEELKPAERDKWAERCKWYEPRQKKPSGPKPGWGKGPDAKKPLVNTNRFYHCNFEPS